MYYQAGLTSFYGPFILTEFTQNIRMHDYIKAWAKQVLFKEGPSCELLPSSDWTSEYLSWVEKNKEMKGLIKRNPSFHWLQENSVRQGRLFGECIEGLEFTKGRKLWPSISDFERAILCLETSEETP